MSKTPYTIMRSVTLAAAALALAACGDLGATLDEAKKEAAAIGQDALDSSLGAVDTQTACMLAGQSEAFCGCVAERLGPKIASEHIGVLREAVTAGVNGQSLEPPGASPESERAASAGSASEDQDSAAPLDASTRQALVQCATRAAIDGAVGEAGN